MKNDGNDDCKVWMTSTKQSAEICYLGFWIWDSNLMSEPRILKVKFDFINIILKIYIYICLTMKQMLALSGWALEELIMFSIKILSDLYIVFPQADHLHNFIFFRFSMGFVDSIIAKCKLKCRLIHWTLIYVKLMLFVKLNSLRHVAESVLLFLQCQGRLWEIFTPGSFFVF